MKSDYAFLRPEAKSVMTLNYDKCNRQQIKMKVQSAMTKTYDKNELLRQIHPDSTTTSTAGEKKTFHTVPWCDPSTTQLARKWKRIPHHHPPRAPGESYTTSPKRA